MSTTPTETSPEIIERMFKVGAHFGFSRSRRHPSAIPYLFGTKQRVEIFDLEKTATALERAKAYARALGAEGRMLLLVAGKPEARTIIKTAAMRIGMPYVAGRWIGGTLTNLPEIKKRIARLENLRAARESGELTKYTKKERLLIDREIARLEEGFSGIIPLKDGIPAAMFIVDTRREHIAIAEAQALGVKTIGLTNSDCDLSKVDIAVPGNDAAAESIRFFVDEITAAYQAGRSAGPTKA
jgi:small subunit ribosomal protein S2